MIGKKLGVPPPGSALRQALAAASRSPACLARNAVTPETEGVTSFPPSPSVLPNAKRSCALNLIIVFLTVAPWLSPLYAAPLTLPQAQEKMFAGNLELAAAAREQEKNRFAVNEAKALWYPSVDVSGSYNYATKVGEITTPSTTIGTVTIPGRPILMGDHDKVELGADVSYAFTQSMVNFYNVKYRNYAIRVKDAQIAAQRNQLSFRLGMLYLAWDMASRQLDVQDSLVSQLQRYRDLVANMKAGGLSSNARILEAQARLEMARFDRLSAVNTGDSLRLELLSLINGKDTAITPQPYDFALDSASWRSLGNLAQNTDRPEYKTVDDGIIQLLTLDQITLGQKYPNLGIMAGWRYANPGLNLNDDRFMDYGLIGAQVKWNIFDGFRVSSMRKQTKQQIEVLKKNRENLENAFERNRKQALLQISKAIALKSAATSSLAAADALTADLKNSLDAGVVTQVDYLNAVTQQSKAALAVQQAEFAGKTALLQLYFAIGKELKY